jgi:hypothetical protein
VGATRSGDAALCGGAGVGYGGAGTAWVRTDFRAGVVGFVAADILSLGRPRDLVRFQINF